MLVLGCNLAHLIDGDDKPLPTSSNDRAESNSVSCPISVSYTHLTLPTNREV